MCMGRSQRQSRIFFNSQSSYLCKESEEDEDDEEADVIKMLHNARHLYEGATLEYLVEWKGYKNPSDWTWEPECNLQSTEGKALLAEVKRSSKWPCRYQDVKVLFSRVRA